MPQQAKTQIVQGRTEVECGPDGVPIDFKIKLINPSANQTVALWVRSGEIDHPVTIIEGDQNTWTGGICAAADIEFRIFAVALVNKDGSMDFSVTEPGYALGPIKFKPINGRCQVEGLRYAAG